MKGAGHNFQGSTTARPVEWSGRGRPEEKERRHGGPAGVWLTTIQIHNIDIPWCSPSSAAALQGRTSFKASRGRPNTASSVLLDSTSSVSPLRVCLTVHRCGLTVLHWLHADIRCRSSNPVLMFMCRGTVPMCVVSSTLIPAAQCKRLLPGCSLLLFLQIVLIPQAEQTHHNEHCDSTGQLNTPRTTDEEFEGIPYPE